MLGGEAEAHPYTLAALERPGQEEHDAVLAAEGDAGLVAVAHEGEGVDGAEEMVGVASPRAGGRHTAVLRTQYDPHRRVFLERNRRPTPARHRASSGRAALL